MAGIGFKLSRPLDVDQHVQIIRLPPDEAGPKPGIQPAGDALRDGSGQHREVEEGGSEEGRQVTAYSPKVELSPR